VHGSVASSSAAFPHIYKNKETTNFVLEINKHPNLISCTLDTYLITYIFCTYYSSDRSDCYGYTLLHVIEVLSCLSCLTCLVVSYVQVRVFPHNTPHVCRLQSRTCMSTQTSASSSASLSTDMHYQNIFKLSRLSQIFR
jgi:hypothetical protein